MKLEYRDINLAKQANIPKFSKLDNIGYFCTSNV